jgi:hypothetical protein
MPELLLVIDTERMISCFAPYPIYRPNLLVIVVDILKAKIIEMIEGF